MGFTSDFNRPAMGNAIDDDFDWMRDNWHYILSVAANGSIVLPGWQVTTQGSNKSEPISITLTRGTKKIIIYYTWTSNDVSSIQFCYDNGVGDTSPSVTCYPAISFFYDDSGNPYGTVDPTAQSTLLTDLLAWWTLDETSGTRIDSHGSYDLDTIDSGTSPEPGGVAGLQGNAWEGNTSSRIYRAGSGATAFDFADSTFTLAAWVYVKSWNVSLDGILSKGNGTNGWYLVYRSTSPNWRFHVKTTTTPNASTNDNATTNAWHLLVAYHDADADEIGISVDNGSFTTTSVSGGVGATGTGVILQLGGALAGNYANANIDEVAVWTRRLTSDEITELYNSGAGVTYTDLNP